MKAFLTLAVVVYVLVISSVASAAYPGANGRIAFVRDGDIYTVTPAGTGLRQVTRGAAFDGDPVWSPFGKRIAFVRDGDIYTVGGNGGTVTRVTTSPAEDGSPTWSSGGRYLAFESLRAGTYNIFRLRSSAPHGAPVQLTRDATETPGALGCWHNIRPTWGTNGTIAFTRRNICDFREQLRRMDGDGTSNVSLGRCPETCEWMDYSPDATALALTSCSLTGEGNYDLCRVVRHIVATGAVNPVSRPSRLVWAQSPAWAPSGTHILYEEGSGRIMISTPGGTNVRTLITNAGDPSWQPVR